MTLVVDPQEEVLTVIQPTREEISKMKPSEMLRFASLMGVKQTTHILWEKDKYCALGAMAFIASGGKAPSENAIAYSRALDSLKDILGNDNGIDIMYRIFDLNDRDGRTFNEIATYLESKGY